MECHDKLREHIASHALTLSHNSLHMVQFLETHYSTLYCADRTCHCGGCSYLCVLVSALMSALKHLTAQTSSKYGSSAMQSMSLIKMRRTTHSKFKTQVTQLIDAQETNNTTCETCYAVSNSFVDCWHIIPSSYDTAHNTCRNMDHASQHHVKTGKLNTLPEIPINVLWLKWSQLWPQMAISRTSDSITPWHMCIIAFNVQTRLSLLQQT